ncbi:Mrp/NBP35 family ATP-binding protein [Oceanicella actignis]|uniref:Iron-sulfur cluster carrier protein n=1 Tax=Oceanicella actignis TaxID=1189325 RepID=A0A1M7TUX1_9RHOB|nr:Mrp/NBP35 family ATP-binding protein [Oceanicella actignis]SES79335.1 ATP-binding protein involved in chromosome partitioning [Oceanicella actignis]SHN74517.1 ATP-binding protein involved in chromosome partitioning [Oceanicella actignis]
MSADRPESRPDDAALREAALQALSRVADPADGTDLVSAGRVQGLSVRDAVARFAIEADPARAAALEPLRRAAEEAVRAVPGMAGALAVLTAHAEPGAARPAPSAAAPRPAAPRPAAPDPAASRPAAASASAPPPDLRGARPDARAPAQAPGPAPMPGVGAVVAVASGKGGVGKSTVAANLAVALAARGLRVGLLDADVYGPSQPRMLGVSGRPSSPDGKTILPLRNHGVTMMSIGLMTPEDQAVIWRGPMLMGALQQMLGQVAWGRLDVLLVDLPPGTGDVQMTLCQKVRVAGAVIVSTPQDIALIDARKGIDMFRRMQVPILGVIENMAAFVCDGCGKVHHPFGHGGARAEAEKLGAPFLGEIPLDLAIRTAADGGAPIVVQAPESPQARAFANVAAALADALRDPAGAPEGA